jgi:hypothetical protein
MGIFALRQSIGPGYGVYGSVPEPYPAAPEAASFRLYALRRLPVADFWVAALLRGKGC